MPSLTTLPPTPFKSGPPALENGLLPAPGDQDLYKEELAARVAEQRSKIRALEAESEGRREADRLRIQERLQERRARVSATKEARRQEQLLLNQARQTVPSPATVLSTPQRLDEGFREQIKATLQERKRALFSQQEELRLEDRQARDEAAKQANLRYEAAERARKVEFDVRHKRWLAEAKAKKVREAEQKREWRAHQDELRRAERQRRDEMQALWRHKAAADARRARDEAACQERLASAEQQRLARLREQEQRRLLSLQQDEQRRRDRQTRDESAMQAHLRYTAAVEAQKAEDKLVHQAALRADLASRSYERATKVARAQAAQNLRDDNLRRDRDQRDAAGMRAHLRHEAIAQARRSQQKLLTQEQILPFEGPVPSFLDEEFQYMKRATTTFPEVITPSVQMSCMKAYQKATADASKRLPCGLCGGLFYEGETINVSLEDTNLLYFLEKTKIEPDCCAVKNETVTLCSICSSAIIKQAIPPLSAGNFVNCLFCQDYPAALKNLNTVEEAFIARAHVIGLFLKLTSGAKRGISYRGSRGHCVAVRQDPSQLLRILPARRLQDHTTVTVSWDRGSPPSEENLARFCSVNKAKVLHALLWLCANNPVYNSVSVDYSVLDS
jgi:hypothetical protein